MTPQDFNSNIERFWNRVDRSGDCWVWTGEVNNHGYGRFALWHDGKRSRIFAHRLSLALHGASLRKGDVVMHHCDNPPCVNPDHLAIGTQRDNIHDCMAKGRLDISGLPLGWAWSSKNSKGAAA